MPDWTLRDLQTAVDRWVRESGGGYWRPSSQMLRVMEEVGELARLVNHLHGDKPKKSDEARQELPVEIGDVIFTLLCLANSEGVDLQMAMEGVLAKYQSRDASRWRPAHEVTEEILAHYRVLDSDDRHPTDCTNEPQEET